MLRIEEVTCMVETHLLKDVIFIETIWSFVLSSKIINICNNIAQKYGNVTVKCDSERFSKIWVARVQKESTKIRHQLSQ